MHVVDQAGERAVRGGEGVAFSLFEASGDASGADDFTFAVSKRDLGCHAPLDATCLSGDEFHLVRDGFASAEDGVVVLEEDASELGGKVIAIGTANGIFGLGIDDFTEGVVHKDVTVLRVFDPEHDIGQGLEQAEGDLSGLEVVRELGKGIPGDVPVAQSFCRGI